MRISSAEWERVISHYANPRIVNTPAYRLARFLRDDEAARDLVFGWIERQAVKAMDRGNTLTGALLTNICKRTSLEALIHDHTGASVRLIRAGVRYEKRLAEYQNMTGRLPVRSVREQLWDETVDRDIERQKTAIAKRIAQGAHRGEMVWLPYHDGRSSNPNATRLSTMGGLFEWESLFNRSTRQFIQGPDMREDTDPALANIPCSDESFTPDLAWLEDHHISLDMIAHLSMEDYEALNVDPSILLPSLITEGQTGEDRFADLTGMLGDATVARALMDANQRVPTRTLLIHAGMRRRCVETGLVFERLVRAYPDDNMMSLWRQACQQTGKRGLSADVAGYREYCRQTTCILEWCQNRLHQGKSLRLVRTLARV